MGCLSGEEKGWGPSMYEMEGPRPAGARERADDSTASALPLLPPVTGHRG